MGDYRLELETVRHPVRVAGGTEPQVRAFEEIAKGRRTFARPETLAALVGYGVLEVDELGGYVVTGWALAQWRGWVARRCRWSYGGLGGGG